MGGLGRLWERFDLYGGLGRELCRIGLIHMGGLGR